ncbi:hypothetical protein YQE_03652, partial [Dendroctonus ponderosae]
MFWKYNTTPSSSQIDTLFAKEDVTLEEVMDSEDIISECRVQNKTLIDFLLKPEVMQELVSLTTREPSVEISENIRFKYPNIACELLTCDIPAINERLAGDERLLEKLYGFLENEPPLNPLLASYFSKIMGGLIAKKTEQVLDFLKARDTFLPLLISHLGTSAIMDLMLKLMTQVEGIEMRQNILNWLDSERIIQQLICLLNPKVEKKRHDNVAQLLCDFLRTAKDVQRSWNERADPDPLLLTLESSETIKLLLDQMFDDGKCESSIVGGIQILMVLLDVNQQNEMLCSSSAPVRNDMLVVEPYSYEHRSNYEAAETEQKRKIVSNTVQAIATRLKEFHGLLLDPPKQPSVLTTTGILDPPVGKTRLQVVRLLSHLIPLNSLELNMELINLGTFPVLLDLLLKYPWNNFLHTHVENCLAHVLEMAIPFPQPTEGKKVSDLCDHLVGQCNLIEVIMKAWKDNDEQQAEKKAIRQGYMGHLINLVNRIVKISKNAEIADHLKTLKPEVADALEELRITKLAEVMEQQDMLLGGLHPSSLMENSEEIEDIPFALNSTLQQQCYAQYQLQNMPPLYMEGYNGFKDNTFNDGEDTLQTMENPTGVSFDLSETDMMLRDTIFKQVCAQSINTMFDADDQVFEDPDHTFQTVIEKKDQGDVAENSSDSDDEVPNDEENMDVDPWASAKSDPWSTLASSSSPKLATNWADFSAAAFSEPPAFAATFDSPSPKQAEEPVQPQAEAPSDSEKKAAAGDHPDAAAAVKVEDSTSSSCSQPSKSLVGDACKPADKQEKSPEKSKTEQQEKV